MVEKCVVFRCSSSQNKEKGISMHKIPSDSNPRTEVRRRRQRWIKFVNEMRKHWIGWFFLTSVVLLHFLELQPLPDRKTDWNCLPEASLCGYASSDFVSESILPIYQLHQLARRIRHFASTPRGRKYHTSRIRYYANADSTFHQTRLLTSGDVSLNPGPIISSGPNSTQNQKESFKCKLSCVL